MQLRDQKKVVSKKEMFLFHELGPLVYSESNSASEIMNNF